MSGESPLPYSSTIATLKQSTQLRSAPTESSETTLPFSQSGQLATKILALVSEGKILDSRFKDIRLVSMDVNFDSQTAAISYRATFEQLTWESRKIAGIALVAIRAFNEVVLDFLSKPDVAVQYRLKALASTSKERNSAANHKSSFGALLKDVKDFYHTIVLAPNHKRQKRKAPSGRKEAQSSQQSEPPFSEAPAKPANNFSTFCASLGMAPRLYLTDIAQHVDHAIDMTIQSWFGLADIGPSPSPLFPENPRPKGTARRPPLDWTPMGPTESVLLLGLVHALAQDLRSFTSHVDVFNTVFTELVREQDVFLEYLKDEHSVKNLDYSTEIDRMRRQLP